MEKNFQAYSKYYDLLYRDKDYRKESSYVAKRLREFAPNANSILELGCGSGGHALFLTESGFALTGIDKSNDMIVEAKKKNIPGFNPICGDISTFQILKKFDAAISLFHVISYLKDNSSLNGCFSLTNQHLNEGGLFLFDCWYSPAVNAQKPETRLKRLENDFIEVTRTAVSTIDDQRNVVDVNYEILIRDKRTGTSEILKEKHSMRHFSIPEIELLANQTGFELLNAEEFLSGSAPSDQTWGVCFLLKKKK